MPVIKVIEILYDDDTRVVKNQPDIQTLDAVAQEVRSSILVTAEPKLGTHIVWKREHFMGAPAEVQNAMILIDDFYKTRRQKAKKPVECMYAVVNTDEPYFDRVLEAILIGETLKKANFPKENTDSEETQDNTDEVSEATDQLELGGDNNEGGKTTGNSTPSSDSEREE